MDHYENMGVDPSASVDDIRQAYILLARREHPDLHNETEASRSAAEEKMRGINAAWAVLGDADERSAYDRDRLRRLRPSTTVRPPGNTPGEPGFTNQPDPNWVPYDDSVDHSEFDERFDRPITSGGLPSWLAVAPMMSLISGLVAVIVGGLIGADAAVDVGVAALVASSVLFLTAPLVALGRSRRGDRLG